jgi:hypothetical protein
MPLTDEQQEHMRAALVPCLPALRRAAPPERAKLIREALERAAVQPTWAEWDACAEDLFGGDAPALRRAALHP